MIDWREHIDEPADDSPAVIRASGASVESVLTLLAEGRSIDEIAARDPRLTRDSVRACVGYSLEIVARQREVALIRRRMADAEAHPDRLVSHEDAMQRVRDAIRKLEGDA